MMNADIINRVKSCLVSQLRARGRHRNEPSSESEDSHAEAIAPGLMAAVNGAASVAWISSLLLVRLCE